MDDNGRDDPKNPLAHLDRVSPEETPDAVTELQSVRSAVVRQALAVLAAERERSGAPIARTSVERVCVRFGLTVPEIARLDEGVERDGLGRKYAEEFDDTPEAVAVGITDDCREPALVDRILRHSLLDSATERALGRTIQIARSFQDGIRDGSIKLDARAIQALDRGRKARDIFILANVRLAMDIAKKYAGRGLDVDDLLQEGVIGLMRAVDYFDADLGFRFSTYATWWIKQSIGRAVKNSGRTIRLPVHVADNLAKLRRTVRALRARDAVEFVKPQKIADQLGWPLEKVGKLLVLDAQNFASVDADEGDAPSILDRLPTPTPDPENVTIEIDLKRYLDRCLEQLDPRAREIMRYRFGLDIGESETLEEVGDRYRLTRERIRQIQARTLLKLGVRHATDLRVFVEDAI